VAPEVVEKTEEQEMTEKLLHKQLAIFKEHQ
jgi:hypothetical protein